MLRNIYAWTALTANPGSSYVDYVSLNERVSGSLTGDLALSIRSNSEGLTVNIPRAQLEVLRDAISKYLEECKIKSYKDSQAKVKRGDIVTITRDLEWICSKDTKMWVDTVCEGYILARSTEKEYRSSGIYWIGNGDYLVDEV